MCCMLLGRGSPDTLNIKHGDDNQTSVTCFSAGVTVRMSTPTARRGCSFLRCRYIGSMYVSMPRRSFWQIGHFWQPNPRQGETKYHDPGSVYSRLARKADYMLFPYELRENNPFFRFTYPTTFYQF